MHVSATAVSRATCYLGSLSVGLRAHAIQLRDAARARTPAAARARGVRTIQTAQSSSRTRSQYGCGHCKAGSRFVARLPARGADTFLFCDAHTITAKSVVLYGICIYMQYAKAARDPLCIRTIIRFLLCAKTHIICTCECERVQANQRRSLVLCYSGGLRALLQFSLVF